ncbi:hypothetical protein NEOLEDRAFT_1128332 [Neolentinus lepideus HHB14362 ss-1]|uniref:Uncharacterized protein n=1 Tax=Neolentinus lepideus HHB14362 ss-1 TaxID=1314782 RepID=A0A165VEA8_9AGAM|nr:hypothetical protein NEOLEDRAFT_1128332 [Neolentinus lepideus HHB14362 ss-1]
MGRYDAPCGAGSNTETKHDGNNQPSTGLVIRDWLFAISGPTNFPAPLLSRRRRGQSMDAPVLPPPGTNFLDAIRPSLHDILVSHTFTVLYVPLFIALFWFSTESSRRQVSFVLNVISITLAFVVGVLVDVFAVSAILSPDKPPPASQNIAIGVLGIVQSILVDGILLARLFVVFPWRIISARRRVLIFAFPILLKVARTANLIAYIKVLADAAKNVERLARLIYAPYLKAEWFLQLADNAFASTVFLSKLHPHIHRGSFARKLKTLFYIAVSNFVIPVIFSLIQIIFVYRSGNFEAINAIILVNTSVAVIGVVFATVWAGVERSSNHTEAGQTDTEADAYKKNVIKMLDMRETKTDPVATRGSTATMAVLRPGPEHIGRSPVPPGREKRYQRPVTPEVPFFFFSDRHDEKE